MYYNNNQQFRPYYQQQPMNISIDEMPIQAVRFMNETEANAYIVMPNHKELLIDRDKGIVYLKSADMLGQSSCKIYKFEEMKPSKPNTEIDTKNFLTRDDTKNFVTRKDFDELVKKFESLQPKKV